MINDNDRFIQLLNELYEIYDDVKLIVVLSENFDNKEQTYIAIIVEFRNALDHVMRSICPDQKKDMEKELQDAKDHIIRAGYDAYENISINVGQKIIDDLSKYSKEIISTIFPNYYHNIRPAIANIKAELAEIRAGRLNTNGENSFKDYGAKVQKLIEYYKEVEFQIPELEKQSQKHTADVKRAERNVNIRWITGVIISAIIALAAVIIRWKYFNS